jgi:hypothetical protein
MANSKNHDTLPFLMLRTRAILGMLIIQFLLGMSVNLIGSPGSGLTKTLDDIILILHILIAIGLVIAAVFTIRTAAKLGGQWPRLTRTGASGIGLAFIGGLGTMASQGSLSNWLSYLMSIGFILAFAGYGLLFAKLSSTAATR